MDADEEIKSVLFVCTGNTCRSPLAEAYLKSRRPAWKVDSVGLGATPGAPAAEQAQKVAEDMGLDLSGHRARSLEQCTLVQYDHIFVMSSGHLGRLPEGVEGSLLSSVVGKKVSVKDPYGAGYVEYDRAFKEIVHYLDAFLETGRS